MPGVTDHYADGTYRWWHLSVPSPELLQALADSWLPPSGLALDAGCGLGTEAGHLYRRGWQVAGVDLSPVALAAAAGRNHGPGYLHADLLRLPLRSSAFDACLDRGCFHYLPARHRPGYAAELRRVLRPAASSCAARRCGLRESATTSTRTSSWLPSPNGGWSTCSAPRSQAIPVPSMCCSFALRPSSSSPPIRGAGRAVFWSASGACSRAFGARPRHQPVQERRDWMSAGGWGAV